MLLDASQILEMLQSGVATEEEKINMLQNVLDSAVKHGKSQTSKKANKFGLTKEEKTNLQTQFKNSAIVLLKQQNKVKLQATEDNPNPQWEDSNTAIAHIKSILAAYDYNADAALKGLENALSVCEEGDAMNSIISAEYCKLADKYINK